MTLLNYTDPVPTPAPLTSGSTIQSYTDPTGEVWVAKNGVNGGAWLKARDVLACRVYRNAAMNIVSGTTLLPFDGVTRDNYGLYNGANANAFTPPVAGWYDLIVQLAATTTASGQFIHNRLYLGGGTLYSLSYAQASAATSLTTTTVYSGYLNANDWINVLIGSSVTLAMGVGSTWTFASYNYRGTG
jgi:hypothetical protein